MILSMSCISIAVIGLASCAEDKKGDAKKTGENKQSTPKKNLAKSPPDSREQGDKKTKSSFSILEQLHKDTILRRVRLPRYDKDFTPLSLLTADTMKVINGETIDAEHVSMELYNPDGSIKARTKMHHATYNENDGILEAKEAIYIDGPAFQTSGSGLFYEMNTGRGFLVGPGSTLFQIKQSGSSTGSIKKNKQGKKK